MLKPPLNIPAELDKFFTWCARLESDPRLSGLPCVSARYMSPAFTCYTRVSRLSRGLLGRQALCLANIDVSPAYRGRGLFTALVERFKAGSAGVQTALLVLELVHNERLAARAPALGFSLNTASDEGAPSFYLDRSAPSLVSASSD